MNEEPPDFEIPEPDLTDLGWETDPLSLMEEDNWGELDDISKQKQQNELWIHKTIGCLIPAGLVVAFLMFILVLGVYVAHLILPQQCCRWLPPEELANIHNMLFSGVVGGAVAIVARMYLLKD